MGTAIGRPTVHDHPGCPSMPTRRTRLGCTRDPSHPAGLPAHSAAGHARPHWSRPAMVRPAGGGLTACSVLRKVLVVRGGLVWRVECGVADHMPDIGELVRRLGSSPPFRLLDVARGFLGTVDKVEAVNLLLVDYGQELLLPFGAYQGPPLGQERVEQGEAGVAYRTQAARVSRVQLGWRACVPVTLVGERFGVLDVRLAAEPSSGLVAELERVAMALGFALAAAGRATDEVELVRRGRLLSLPAEIQWELLPRLALEAPEYVVAGTLEPAYEVGGDTFDYAAQPEALTVSVTDAMGHGLQAALLAGLAVAALRNARRGRARQP